MVSSPVVHIVMNVGRISHGTPSACRHDGRLPCQISLLDGSCSIPISAERNAGNLRDGVITPFHVPTVQIRDGRAQTSFPFCVISASSRGEHWYILVFRRSYERPNSAPERRLGPNAQMRPVTRFVSSIKGLSQTYTILAHRANMMATLPVIN